MIPEQVHTVEETPDALYAEVILPLPLQKLYTYRIPSEFFELAVPGKRVFVPFGNRKVYTGIIMNISSSAPKVYEALNIISVLDDVPLLGKGQLEFWKWIADYYMCSVGEVMAAALPAGLKLASETYIALEDQAVYNPEELDERELSILKALEGKEKLRISDLETLLKSRTSMVKMVKSLYERQLIVMFEDVSEKYKAKKMSRVRVMPGLDDAAISAALAKLETKAAAQYRAFLALLGEKNTDAFKSELIRKFNLQPAALRALAEKGLVQQYEVETGRFAERTSEEAAFELSMAQSTALNQIQDFFDEGKNVLLHGETASGKTFLYIELIRRQIQLGKSVLYLIPELALTEQLIQRLEQYFGSEMMVTHSRFSLNEKVEIWHKALNGEIKLLLGSRSALFMPLKHTGLIIVDEEHEPAFKQHEKSPRYHARDAALVLAGMQNCRVLMGSATPSVESYHNALSGKYGLVELRERYGNAVETQVLIGDMKSPAKNARESSIFTPELIDALKHVKEKGRQAILFQNRKGYVPMLECSTCGWVSKCVNCDIALTYYKYSNNLRCHYCGFHQPNISKCSACGNNTMSIQGYGTERIAEELSLYLPELRIIRFDQDSTRQKNAFRKLLTDFENGYADVMVGTQIAVKGLDYGRVDLTAVVNADHLLNFPDFRSHERTFQLLYQLAGRAGRRGEAGSMIIQTRQKEHPVIQAVIRHDFKGFYHMQIEERRQFAYPPFSKLIKLTLKHKSPETINTASSAFASLLKQQLGSRVLGPETPYVSRIKNYYLRNYLIKLDVGKDKPSGIKQFIAETFDFMIKRDNLKGLILAADVDVY